MKKIVSILVLTLLVLPIVASAQDYPDPVETICTVLELIKDILLAVGLGLAIIILIIGGIQYLTAGGDATKTESAKKLVINALIGIVIILVAAFILALVQGLLTNTGITIFGNPC